MGRGRPPTPVGTFGKITYAEQDSGAVLARTRFRDYDGIVRPVARSGKTQAAAERELRKALRERQTPTGTGLTRDSRVSEVADRYLEQVISEAALAPRSLEHYTYVIDSYLRPTVGALRLSEASVGTIERALAGIRTKHGPGAGKSARSVLSLVLGLATRQDAIASNPVRDTSRMRTRKNRARGLSAAEEDRLRGSIRDHARAQLLDLPDLVDYMLSTGCRIAESCAARDAYNEDGEQVLDLDAGTFEVNATVQRHAGKGLVLHPRPKTAAGWRVLALPDHAVELVARRKAQPQLRAAYGVVFGSAQSRSLRDPSNTPGDLREVLDDLGFPWVTSHTFRKTVTTKLLNAGVPPQQVADHVGHSNPSLTLDHYAGRQVTVAVAAKVLALPA